MPHLHQIIALVSDRKRRFQESLTALHQKGQKPGVTTGFIKSYKPIKELETADPRIPPTETKRVEMVVTQAIEAMSTDMVAAFDACLMQDIGNTTAKGTISLGTLKLENIPSTYLLFLEKRVIDLLTFIEKLPTLEPDTNWSPTGDGQYRSDVSHSVKTAKEVVPIVKYPATPEHPAQTEMVTKDVVICRVETVGLSGALPIEKKEAMRRRCIALREAINAARSEANAIKVPDQQIGKQIFDFIFGDL